MRNSDSVITALNTTISRLSVLGIAFMAQVPHTIAVFTEGERCTQWSCLVQLEHLPAVAAGIARLMWNWYVNYMNSGFTVRPSSFRHAPNAARST